MNVRHRLPLLAVLAAAALPATALAQATAWEQSSAYGGSSYGASAPKRQIHLTGFAGYQLNSDVELTTGHLEIDDAPVYGASLGFEVRPNYVVELLWLYSEPTARASGFTLGTTQPFSVATHYFQIGGTSGVRKDRLEFYGSGTLGAALLMPGEVKLTDNTRIDVGDTWRFAFTVGVGLKVHLNDRLALRFEPRLTAPVYFSSGGFYVGTGGAAIGVSGGLPLLQWDFLGGLTFSP